MIVIKRDGREENFNKEKIIYAIQKTFISEEEIFPVKKIKEIADEIESFFKDDEKIKIFDIEELVIEKLKKKGYDKISKSYSDFRNYRTIEREKASTLISKIKKRIEATNVENSNANVDENSFTGREKEASSDLQKFMAIELEGLDKEVAKAHKEMLVYQHDLEKALVGMHNCLQLDFQEIFSKGFSTRNGTVRPPQSFRAACQLMAVAFQRQSQNQFGGVGSIHADFDLAPFIKKSFSKHLKNGLKYIENIDIDIPKSISIEDKEYKEKYPRAFAYALDMLDEEVKQSCEALFHNLNTLESRQGGQVPFTSINYGRDTSPEGRMVIKGLLQASINGIGEHHLTSIFPISIFQLKKGVNKYPGDPNYDLYQLALKSLSKRIYPNIVNCDWSEAHEDKNNIDTFMSTMGKCKLQLI